MTFLQRQKNWLKSSLFVLRKSPPRSINVLPHVLESIIHKNLHVKLNLQQHISSLCAYNRLVSLKPVLLLNHNLYRSVSLKPVLLLNRYFASTYTQKTLNISEGDNSLSKSQLNDQNTKNRQPQLNSQKKKSRPNVKIFKWLRFIINLFLGVWAIVLLAHFIIVPVAMLLIFLPVYLLYSLYSIFMLYVANRFK